MVQEPTTALLGPSASCCSMMRASASSCSLPILKPSAPSYRLRSSAVGSAHCLLVASDSFNMLTRVGQAKSHGVDRDVCGACFAELLDASGPFVRIAHHAGAGLNGHVFRVAACFANVAEEAVQRLLRVGAAGPELRIPAVCEA